MCSIKTQIIFFMFGLVWLFWFNFKARFGLDSNSYLRGSSHGRVTPNPIGDLGKKVDKNDLY